MISTILITTPTQKMLRKQLQKKEKVITKDKLKVSVNIGLFYLDLLEKYFTSPVPSALPRNWSSFSTHSETIGENSTKDGSESYEKSTHSAVSNSYKNSTRSNMSINPFMPIQCASLKQTQNDEHEGYRSKLRHSSQSRKYNPSIIELEDE